MIEADTVTDTVTKGESDWVLGLGIVLFWLHMWFSNLNGFGNAIVYGFNDSLRDGLKK